MSGRLGAWVLGAALLSGAIFTLTYGSQAPPPIGRGSPAPGFELPRAGDGVPIGLEAQRGKVVLINFWATWCKPCEDEMPAMERLYRGFPRDDFELLAISVDSEPELVTAFRDRLGLSFPILLDASNAVAGAYQTFRFPETFLVDPDGVVVERYVGPRDWDAAAYVERVRRLLSDPNPG